MSGLMSLLSGPWAQQVTAPTVQSRSSSGVSGGQAASGSAQTGASSPDFLSSSNFFQLLTAQLSHQDPLSPMNSTKFMSELAQLSTANGMKQLGQSVSTLQSGQSAATRLRATDLIGHYVGTSGNTMTLSSGGGATGGYVLPSSASQVKVTVTDKAGAVVDQMNLGAKGAGQHRFTWSGSGQSPGEYQFSVQALNASGSPLQTQPLSLAKISSVAFSGSGGIDLSFADRSGTLPFGQVTTIF